MKGFGLFKGNNKGQLGLSGPLGQGVNNVFGLFLIGIFIFAFAIAGAEMKGATTDPVAIEVINKTVEGAQSFANFSPTLWIIAAIAVLVGILIFSFAGVYYNRM